MMTRSITRLLTLTLGLLLFAQAQAGQEDFGDYQVHWSVFPSTFLDPEVARANNLQRSRGIGIINISIMTEGEHGQIRPVGGQVQGQVTNDIQQVNFLAFRRIQEGDAVYFIAQYQYRSGDLMTFNITARPTGHNRDLPVRFSHTLFND
ncbi:MULTISPECIES: DUF4426 domain-containing protein [Marinobacter]|nr:DUF4426 domain-containing protein [Marinobacter sp.]MCD1629437.1 DUF4426 domain-containing protein [Marinobacter shengliensis]PSF14099.1 DUF4426 domain-containing protein [Marinobacter shengliensis]BBJ05022.1 hypothetical protein YBY_28710 [Marinobacter nauticus]BEH13224.1 hypothetical protein MAALD49_05920 [Marinobacter shengliensis]